MLESLAQLESSGMKDLESVDNADALEAWRIKFLGTKGALKAIMSGMKNVPKEQKASVGARLNEVKHSLESAFERKKQQIGQTGSSAGEPFIDVTEPGVPRGLGRRHVLSRTVDEITEIFARMGFTPVSGPELEDEWHNFNALNIPQGHPAREVTDNFYLANWQSGDSATDRSKSPNHEIKASPNPHLMLRSQTSTVQIRTMQKMKPPLKVIACGRVYRPDTHDATHFSMFHQIEGLYVDRRVSMVDLKTTLFQFARAYFGPGAEVRMRPSFFPFTEPSAEVDMKMKIKLGEGEYKWVELGGCGMVDPNVFEAVGYDPEEWAGFAFGLGIERIAMRKYGIADIRWLFDNDVRFLQQF